MEKGVMKESRIYPAVFHKEEDGRYSVVFPDLGCATDGDTIEQAYKMAKEALALWLDGEECVAPSKVEDVKVDKNEKVMLVEADAPDNIEYFAKNKVAKAIEEGLEKKEYTKYQIAYILGVDRGYITHLIKGERTPSVEMAKRIAMLLNFNWEIFYEDSAIAK